MDCKIWLFLSVSVLFRFRETVKFDLALALPSCLAFALAKQDCFVSFSRGEREFFYSNLLAWTKKNWRILG